MITDYPHYPYETAPPNPMYIGVDLGQSDDFTAYTISEQLRAPFSPVVYHMRHLERDQPRRYGMVIDRVRDMIEDLRSPVSLFNVATGQYEMRRRPITVVVDRTGVGRAVGDQFSDAALACDLVLVSITPGDAVTRDGGHFKVPKRDIVSSIAVLLQTDRLKIVDSLPLSAVMKSELKNFKIRYTKRGHDIYNAGTSQDLAEWRDGGLHDDLVLAAGLSLWYAETYGHGEFQALPTATVAAMTSWFEP